MKRIFFSLIFVSGLIFSPTTFANAATDGCPDTWQVDKTIKGGWSELNQAKLRLGSNMVLEVDEYSMIYSDYSGELGPMPKPKVNLLGAPDIYLYGNTKVALKVTVQVKGCSGKTDFSLEGGTLKEYLGLRANPPFIKTNAEDFANLKGELFIDFVKAREFPACMENMTKATISNASRMEMWAYQYISRAFIIPNSEFCGLITSRGAMPILLNLTPDCSMIYAEANEIPRRLGISITSNKKCEYAFGFSDQMTHKTEAFLGVVSNLIETQNPIYVLESFKVSGPVTKKTTITCFKGKLTKKVTALKPSCPSGFKKK
jgi:hypothetical protein